MVPVNQVETRARLLKGEDHIPPHVRRANRRDDKPAEKGVRGAWDTRLETKSKTSKGEAAGEEVALTRSAPFSARPL